MPPQPSRRIHVLRDSVARKIAAGEVIDRPFSVLRELVDNSLDAGASLIEVRLEQGGIDRLEVQDDGGGLTQDDLELCWLPHATSKIETEDDLDRIRTLGFRGEALGAIAASARLFIRSATDDSGLAWTLNVDSRGEAQLEAASGPRGTLVRVSELFHDLPARRRFLKSSGSEALACRRLLEEKALAHPETAFRFSVDGQVKAYWPRQEPLERLFALYGEDLAQGMLRPLAGEGPGLRVTGFTSRPGLNHRDRSRIQIYCNRRRIQDFALVQSVVHAYAGWLPGGAFPFSYVFIDIDPSLVDVNVHPAKREVRWRTAQSLHGLVLKTIRAALEGEHRPEALSDRGQPQPGLGSGPASSLGPALSFGPAAAPNRRDFFSAYQSLRERRAGEPGKDAASPAPESAQDAAQAEGHAEGQAPLLYLGQAFEVFLLVQQGPSLFLIDQHAAHERILFDRLLAAPVRRLPLLIPLEWSLEAEASQALAEQIQDLAALGITLEQPAPGQWRLTHVPEQAAHREGEMALWLQQGLGSAADLIRRLYADTACKAALKEGDPIDPATGLELARQALALPEPRCPHGRPVWLEWSRDDLYQRIGRLV